MVEKFNQQRLQCRYNLFYAYKRSKISKQIHATAVNCVIVCLLLQQLVLLFFNMIRGNGGVAEAGDGSLLSARAIFSITMFTIFSGMFVLQVSEIYTMQYITK